MTKLYDPTASPKSEAATLAARLPDLHGKTIGHIINERGDKVRLCVAAAERKEKSRS